jgi:hypothetical protein
VRGHTTQTVLNKEIKNERKAAALGVPCKEVLGIKALLRAGVCRPREKLARSITSLASSLTPPCFRSLLLSFPTGGLLETTNYSMGNES